MKTEQAYLLAKEQYAKIGVDTDKALEKLKNIKISMHCWQGDDVLGFLFKDIELSGGIQTTGNYPGRANTADELRADLDKALSLIPGKHKLNLHAIYADTDEKVDLDELEPKHFEKWVAWAKENVISSNLQDRKVRYIVDDVVKFVNREIRRGNKYDAIIMDPPSYGRGANGEVWKFEENICELVELCSKVLSDNPLFFLINSYTTGISSTVLENILRLNIDKKYKGKLSNGEIGLPMTGSNLILPCGIFGKWEK